ncbi:hypothetical protein [Sphaerisporangium siamense]|uniref:Small nuclear ribonucleoprotein (SnRNP)-like protein n=1 Tax=Sphaerisporangium siamense TaxID=795645 RepID=A0A7W7D9R1_9ACTN|nr:hypothetical protein [Sphaerisporangium siamense]MBB4702559.1 small nuclear ribonucleoprotein (snRNP)-like protein [Sphaerisporangium siamense]
MNDPDRALQALVTIIDRDPSRSIGLTLTVNGAVLTGVLVSVEEYANNVVQDIRHTYKFLDYDQEDYNTLFAQLGANAQKQREQREAANWVAGGNGNLKLDLPEFLHLRDGFTLTGDRLPTGEGAWWRIRLADVTAWTPVSMGMRKR